MPRSPLTEQYERILTIIDEINSWPDDERNFLLDRLDPKEEVKAVKKKSSKKSAGKGGGGKSKHASSLESAIKGTTGDVTESLTGVEAKGTVGQLGVKIEEDGVLSSGGNRCQFKREDGRTCMLLPDHNIHHLTTAREYHYYFAPPATHAATGD